MESREGKGRKRPLRARARTHRLPRRPAAESASGTSEHWLAEETLASRGSQGQPREGKRGGEQGAGLPNHVVPAASRDAGAVRALPAPTGSPVLGFA